MKPRDRAVCPSSPAGLSLASQGLEGTDPGAPLLPASKAFQPIFQAPPSGTRGLPTHLPLGFYPTAMMGLPAAEEMQKQCGRPLPGRAEVLLRRAG